MKKTIDSRQMSLFDGLHIPKAPDLSPGSLNYATELRHAISEALKRTAKDRFEVAAEMSRLLGIEISKSQLDSWSAESRTEWRFPVEYLAAFEAACGTFSILELLARKRGCRVIMGDECRQVEIGRLEAMKEEISKKLKMLKQTKVG